jgi:hypothetical protein
MSPSKETIALIAESRLIAIELGSEIISTIHFFLSDCRLNARDSIKSFVFRSEEEFSRFYKNQKVTEPSILVDSLPLTIEAARTVKKAVSFARNRYKDDMLRPYHLFLAAIQLEKTFFYSILQPKENLFQKLENYYVAKGVIKQNNQEGLWTKVSKIFLPKSRL